MKLIQWLYRDVPEDLASFKGIVNGVIIGLTCFALFVILYYLSGGFE